MPLDAAPYEEASATLLAKQPLVVPEQRPKAEWTQLFQHLESRMSGLRSWRWTWWSTWMSLAEFLQPRRAKAFIVANNYSRGNWLNDSIIDGTGTLAANTCSAGMWNGLMSPARPWFKLALADAANYDLDEEGKQWLEEVERRVYTVFAKSNFYQMWAQAFNDIAVFGTSPVIIYEDDAKIINCFVPCIGEYFLQVGSHFTVNTLYREFTLTVLQMVEMFELENCPRPVQSLFEQGGAALDQEMIVGHAIEPNFPISARGKRGKAIDILPKSFTFREVYWLRGQKTTVPFSVRGFNELPFVCGRGYTVSNDAYGRSFGMDALGDVKQIQQETLRKAEFLEKGVRPPMGADPELKNEPASIMPGMITFVSTTANRKGFFPLFEVNATWLQHLTVDIKDVRDRIKEYFFVPLFMAITQMQGVQPRNELELTKRDLERLQVLGPFIEQFENECAGPAIERTVRIMERRGLIPPMPDSLKGVPIKIEHKSIMRQAQQAAEAVAMKDFAQTIGVASLAAKNAGAPDPARVVNWDEYARSYAEITGTRVKILFTPDEVKQQDQMRERALQQQQMATQGPEMLSSSVDAAKALSETQLGNGSALDALIGPGAYPG